MKTVLTVDDNRVARLMVRRYLEGYGCQVIEAANGLEGIAAAREHKPDLILLDINMPEMDGRQALADLRKDPTCKSLPVIMLTADSSRDIVLEVARLGVVGYIVKPFEKEAFDKQVSKVLGTPGTELATDYNAPIDPEAVLVVDDSERVLESARAALQQTMTVLTAATGKDALTCYQRARPGVVVIDLTMPEMDGFETLAEIRRMGSSHYVALAVRGDDASVHERARTAGFHSVVEKPFQAQVLLDSVRVTELTAESAEELLHLSLRDENGCAVFDLPDPRSEAFGRVLVPFAKHLRALAEEGTDKLIFDLTRATDMNSAQLAALVRIITGAGKFGIRTAICASDQKVVECLRQIDETRDIPCEPSREAARQSLQ